MNKLRQRNSDRLTLFSIMNGFVRWLYWNCGNVCISQVRQNYKINEGKESPLVAEVAEEREQSSRGSDGKPPKGNRHRRPEGQSDDANKIRTPRFPRDPRDPSRKFRGDLVPQKKPKMDIEYIARARAKTAEEAARAASIAVAEAEAAAAAAEQATWDAEAAEAEAEALEAAAEAAMAAIRPPKKCESSQSVLLGWPYSFCQVWELACLNLFRCCYWKLSILSKQATEVKAQHLMVFEKFLKLQSVTGSWTVKPRLTTKRGTTEHWISGFGEDTVRCSDQSL